MPWHLPGSPSIQLGTLQALLHRADVPCRSHSFYLEFLRLLAELEPRCGALGIEDYGDVASRWMNVGAGEWVFAVSAIRKSSAERDAEFFELCRTNGMSLDLVGKLERTREHVPAFLARCADEILASDPAAVGFSAVYAQTIPSAALAHTLKTRAPDLKIVFGGASCEGPMGPAILRAFDDVDVIVRGEAERVLPELARDLVCGAPIGTQPGLCFRERGAVVAIDGDDRERVPMDDVPVPEFDEYFERLANIGLSNRILPQIPFETARGCWWGMKAHCTFCGLNGTSMAFRSKSPARVLDELSVLSLRHGVLDFTCTDNILDMRYFDSLLPGLVERGTDLSFFFETKANLTEPQVRALRAAGIRAIQPGIESLSTPILTLMKKGVTALQNIRLLKWCARHDVRVIWNLLHGFPREPREEYQRMASLIPSLVHLEPPTFSALMVYRFSPYHARPAEHGIELGDPLPCYRLLYDIDDDCLGDLAQAFEYSHQDGRDPSDYTSELRAGVERWNGEWERNSGALTCRRGPGFLVILDSRTTSTSSARYTLGEQEAAVYLACDAGATVSSIAAHVRGSSAGTMSEDEIRRLLEEFVDARLMYEERGRYLSLAVHSAS